MYKKTFNVILEENSIFEFCHKNLTIHYEPLNLKICIDLSNIKVGEHDDFIRSELEKNHKTIYNNVLELKSKRNNDNVVDINFGKINDLNIGDEHGQNLT